jgi:hypothetical protein
MWKTNDRAGQVKCDNKIRHMRFACCTNTATYTHSDYVILLFHGNSSYANRLNIAMYVHWLSCLRLSSTVIASQSCYFISVLDDKFCNFFSNCWYLSVYTSDFVRYIYHGAFTAARRTLFWYLCNISIFELNVNYWFKLFIRYVRRADNFTTFMCRLSRNLGASTYRNPMGLSRHEQGFLYLCYVKVQMIIPILKLKFMHF